MSDQQGAPPPPPPVEGATCSTCRWAVAGEGPDLVCRGGPPTAVPVQVPAQVLLNGWPQTMNTQRVIALYPSVGPLNWCGAHRPKQAALRSVGGAT